MIDVNRMTSRLRRALRPAAALAASALLLCSLPAAAGLSGAIGAGGAGHSLKETLAETADNFSEMVGAFIDGDDERVSELVGEVAKTPGKLIKRTFPVLEAPQAIANRLTFAKQKIERFVGGVGESLTDARAALAVGGDDKSGGWSDAALLEGEPLKIPADTVFAAPNHASRAEALAALKGIPGQGPAAGTPADSWDFEKWVIAEQEANPHCYGVVDLETLPSECFGGASAESPTANRVEDSPQAGESDWASGNWTIEGDGWSGWDKSDLRYSEADRNAARVSHYAAHCWGVYGVSRHDPTHDLMRERMQRNECPNEETSPASSDDAGNEYAAALNDLQAKEAERLRLEAEEREREARLEDEEERERQARLAQQREFNRQAAQQMSQALGGLIRAYSGEGTYSGGGTTGGGAKGGSVYCGPGGVAQEGHWGC